MAETTADVKRDIELTRERMSSTLAELERRLNLGQMVKEHPWPALGLAFGAGLLLSGSKVDVKAAAATLAATQGATTKVGGALDDLVGQLMGSLGEVLDGHVETLLAEVKQALGAHPSATSNGDIPARPFSTYGDTDGAAAIRAD